MKKEKPTPYAQIPLKLLESDLSESAKILYANYHSFCGRPKNLDSCPKTQVGRPTLAERMKKSESCINQLDIQLKRAGWISKSKVIKGRYTITTLFPLPNKEEIEKNKK